MLVELEDAGRDGEAALARRHGGEALALADGLGEVFVVPVLHAGLVVEEVELRRRADEVEVDDARGFGREVGEGGEAAFGFGFCGAGSSRPGFEERGEGRGADA